MKDWEKVVETRMRGPVCIHGRAINYCLHSSCEEGTDGEIQGEEMRSPFMMLGVKKCTNGLHWADKGHVCSQDSSKNNKRRLKSFPS